MNENPSNTLLTLSTLLHMNTAILSWRRRARRAWNLESKGKARGGDAQGLASGSSKLQPPLQAPFGEDVDNANRVAVWKGMGGIERASERKTWMPALQGAAELTWRGRRSCARRRGSRNRAAVACLPQRLDRPQRPPPRRAGNSQVPAWQRCLRRLRMRRTRLVYICEN